MNSYYQPTKKFDDLSFPEPASQRCREMVSSLTEEQAKYALISLLCLSANECVFQFMVNIGLPRTLQLAEGYVLTVELMLSGAEDKSIAEHWKKELMARKRSN